MESSSFSPHAPSIAPFSPYYVDFVILLQSKHIYLVLLQGGDAASDGRPTRERGNAGNSVLHGSAANGAPIKGGIFA